ncbi:MAG: 6-carboxytetrahydropterin synthase [Bdellovibrionales bacterium]|nr:6-carboxytetrahydropterin synthase [Bdellovibrionales bacterium]
MSRCTLSRKVHFSCLHKYEVDSFSEKENIETFGACYTKHGHGHSYELVGYFSGKIDEETGMIINLKDVDDILKTATSELDGKHLNFEVEKFKTKVPTTENLVLHLADHILGSMKSFPQIELTRLRLYETEDLWVEWENG